MKCVAIDDEEKALEVIEMYIQRLSNIELVAKFTDPVEASKFLNQNPVDILFLDINMGGLDGFELLESLSYTPKVIFTTAYSEFAVKSYNVDAVDYLVKPIPFSRFLKAVNKVEASVDTTRQVLQQNSPEQIVAIKSGTAVHRIKTDEILYLEAEGNYTRFVTANEKILALYTMKEALAKLNDNFIQTHRSYSIALNKVNKVENHQVTIGEKKIPIGVSFRKQVLDVLNL